MDPRGQERPANVPFPNGGHSCSGVGRHWRFPVPGSVPGKKSYYVVLYLRYRSTYSVVQWRNRCVPRANENLCAFSLSARQLCDLRHIAKSGLVEWKSLPTHRQASRRLADLQTLSRACSSLQLHQRSERSIPPGTSSTLAAMGPSSDPLASTGDSGGFLNARQLQRRRSLSEATDPITCEQFMDIR